MPLILAETAHALANGTKINLSQTFIEYATVSSAYGADLNQSVIGASICDASETREQFDATCIVL